MKKIVWRSFLNALGTIAYVSVIATLMQNGEKIFGKMDNTTGPIAFLTMFVLSTAVTGSLVLGKPILLYLNNQKTEAIKMFIFTLCWLALAVIILLLSSVLFK
jgi:hypothetical protein